MTNKVTNFFEEGKTYKFVVNGKVHLPPNEEEFLILLSHFGSKHLLQYLPYKDYGLKNGNEVNCRIDKISCSGKMYLEPEHISFKEGSVYSFKNLGFEEILNSDERAERFLRLEDLKGNAAFVNIGDHSPRDFSDKVFCRVDRIKKGKLYLSLAQTAPLLSKLDKGKTYEFIITDLVSLAEDEEYFMLLDEFDELHYLCHKYFEDYGFSIGDTIRCYVLNKPQLFRHYLEPEHPIYRIGGKYDFLVSDTEIRIDEFGEEIVKLIVKDDSKKEYFADCDNYSKMLPEIGTTVRCSVEDIRMSKLLLLWV
jgi:hypothetical protein